MHQQEIFQTPYKNLTYRNNIRRKLYFGYEAAVNNVDCCHIYKIWSRLCGWRADPRGTKKNTLDHFLDSAINCSNEKRFVKRNEGLTYPRHMVNKVFHNCFWRARWSQENVNKTMQIKFFHIKFCHYWEYPTKRYYCAFFLCVNKRSGNPWCIICFQITTIACSRVAYLHTRIQCMQLHLWVCTMYIRTYIIYDWLKCAAVRRRSQQRLVAASLLIAKVEITTLRLTTLCLPSSVTFFCYFVYSCLYTDIHTYENTYARVLQPYKCLQVCECMRYSLFFVGSGPVRRRSNLNCACAATALPLLLIVVTYVLKC